MAEDQSQRTEEPTRKRLDEAAKRGEANQLTLLRYRVRQDFLEAQAAALNLPLKGLAARLGEIEKHRQRPVILNCRTDRRSRAAASVLAKAGFSAPIVLAGGFTAWQGENLPTEK